MLFLIPDKYLHINTKIQISLLVYVMMMLGWNAGPKYDDGRYYSKRSLINFS